MYIYGSIHISDGYFYPVISMTFIQQQGLAWSFLSQQERVLAGDGEFLIRDSLLHKDEEPTDYSYLIFPFAKLYEGFLKDLFLNLSIISEQDYYSTHFRIGRALNPNLAARLGKRSAYAQMADRFDRNLANTLWEAWKEGRNLVFHYFPGNIRLSDRNKAMAVIQQLAEAMEEGVKRTGVKRLHEPVS